MTVTEALLAATALHAGFQAVVTVVVYPALRDLPRDAWAAGHAAHSRRITVLVGPVYLVVLLACGWSLYDGVATSWGGALAVGGNALALATTALVAAPTHGRLGREGPEPTLLARLLLADRVRLLAVLVALTGAVFA